MYPKYWVHFMAPSVVLYKKTHYFQTAKLLRHNYTPTCHLHGVNICTQYNTHAYTHIMTAIRDFKLKPTIPTYLFNSSLQEAVASVRNQPTSDSSRPIAISGRGFNTHSHTYLYTQIQLTVDTP